VLVDVGVGLIADQGVGVLRHGRRDIGVVVRFRHDRQVLTQSGAEAPQDFAVGVEVTRRHHRPVERQEQAVGRPPTTSLDDLPDDLVDHRVVDGPGRRGPGHRGRAEFVAEPLGSGDEPPELVVGVAPDRQHGIAASQAPILEPATIGRRGREGVRLVDDPADGDTHGRRTSRTIPGQTLVERSLSRYHTVSLALPPRKQRTSRQGRRHSTRPDSKAPPEEIPEWRAFWSSCRS
jgi:hypothetical protein